MTEPAALRTAIGRYAETAALLDGRVAVPGLSLVFEHPAPISRAFAPMVRQARYEVSEMAIATFLMARAAGLPLVLLPVVLAARFQEAALLCRADAPITGPADLAGARIAVRAYSQTTGMWLRGALAELHGVRASEQRWTTFEDAHLPGFQDPPWVSRAAPGEELLALLQSGRVEAAIFGNDLPDMAGLRTVFPDVAAAGAAFEARYGFVPVNHLVVMQREHAARAPALLEALAQSGVRVQTRAALSPALSVAIRFCAEQGLLPGGLSLEQAWEGLPEAVA